MTTTTTKVEVVGFVLNLPWMDVPARRKTSCNNFLGISKKETKTNGKIMIGMGEVNTVLKPMSVSIK